MVTWGLGLITITMLLWSHNLFTEQLGTPTSLTDVVPLLISSTSELHDSDMTDCLVEALDRYGQVYPENTRPAIFAMRTSTFSAIFFSVPGDEGFWNNVGNKYSWQGLSATLIFVGQLFERANKRGFSMLAGRDESSPALIDVGANMGQEVVLAGMAGLKATTFEILPHSVKAIQFNLAANCVPDGLVTIVNSGASRLSGNIQIDLKGFTAAKQTVASAQGNFNATVWSLDEYLLGGKEALLTARPLLFKLDCEGCEAEALAGSLKILERFPPHYIMVEFMFTVALRDILKELIAQYNYSRALVLDCDDKWVRQSHIAAEEELMLSTERQVWNPDTDKRICDLVFVHDDAIDLGLFEPVKT